MISSSDEGGEDTVTRIDSHFHGEQTGGNEAFHEDGAVIVAQDNVRVRLAAGTTNYLNGRKTLPAPTGALPTETYVGGTKSIEFGGRTAVLTHANNAHTDGDTLFRRRQCDLYRRSFRQQQPLSHDRFRQRWPARGSGQPGASA
jgi:glyoxylase-like metal-dependent hydrolase (beta-lactamase superfamily II)